MKFDIYYIAVVNGQNNLVIPHSYLYKNNPSYRAVDMVWKPDFGGVYV